MFNLQGSEIIFILLIALVVLGPEKLPDAVKKFTNTYNELRKMGSGLQSELRSVIDEPTKQVQETAAMLRDAASPDLLGADGLPGDEAEFYEPAEPADRAPTEGADETATVEDPPAPDGSSTADDGTDEHTAHDASVTVSPEAATEGGEPPKDDQPKDDQPAKPFNTIAAANSSAGLAARAAAMERAKQAAAEREAAASNGAAKGPSESGADDPIEQAAAPDEAASA